MISQKNNKLTLIGALTSKPYAFKARPWELKNAETIDLFDSICSNIRVDIRGSEIMRVLPINNQYINEEWISDKTRFAYDGLKRKRFISPLLKKNDFFVQSNWKNAFETIQENLKNKNFSNLIINTGNNTDLEQLVLIEQMSSNLKNVVINNNHKVNADLQQYYTINNNLLNESEKKIYILVGSNLRVENPILNIKLKKLSEKKTILVAYIGPKYNTTIDMYHIGTNLNNLNLVLKGKHAFCQVIQTFLKTNQKNKKINSNFNNNISIIFGNEFIQLKNSAEILTTVANSKLKNIKFDVSVLKMSAGEINALELGLYSNKKAVIKNNALHYLINKESTNDLKDTGLVIFQGTHNEKIRTKFDIILPGFSWLEKSSLYINALGIIQKSEIVLNAPTNTREDWKISKMFLACLNNINNNLINKDFKENKTLNTINDIHSRLNELSPNLMDNISVYKNSQQVKIKKNKNFNLGNINFNINLKSFINDFYKITSIEKNSKIMNNCSDTINVKKNNFFKN
jgi:NADH dehydrogenase/NADH:ubiquinone oxidoreductase subunit G